MLSLDQLAIDMCVSFAVNELAQFGAHINAAQTEAQLHTVLSATIHETWLEGAVEAGADAVIEALPIICANAADVKTIVDDVTSGNLPDAIKTFKGLVAKTLPVNGEFTTELKQLLGA